MTASGTVRRGATLLIAAVLAAGCTSAVVGHGRLPSRTRTSAAAAHDFPSASKQTTTTDARPTRTAPTFAELIAHFAGRWLGHGRLLRIRGEQGDIIYRVYKFCSDDPTPPCDELQGNQIIDGGRVTLDLHNAYQAGNATIAEGVVTSTTDPTLAVGTELTARVQHHFLSLTLFPGAPFCDDRTPARVAMHQCGA